MQTIDQRVIKIRLIHEMIQRLILEYLLRVPSRDLLVEGSKNFMLLKKIINKLVKGRISMNKTITFPKM